MRRDFTINGMFYDIQSDQLIDYVGGQKDIINQLIRTVGEPERRFSEDYLRMMRAIRFASQLQFQIESETFGSISKLSHQIENVSGERIYAELKKTFISPEPLEGFNRFAETGVLKSLFPKMKLFQAIWSEGEYDFWTQFKSVIHGLGRDSREEIFWSMMIYFECLMPSDSTNKAPSEKLMERMGESFEFLHFSNELRRRIFFIVRALLRLMQEKPLPPMAQRLRWFGDPAGLSLMDMWHILLVQGNEPTGVFFETLDRYISIAQKNGELPLSHLKGKDLIEMGIKKGPLIGSLLKEVYDMQLEGKINSRQMALNWVESHIN